MLDERRVEEEPQHLRGFPHRGGGHLPCPKWLEHRFCQRTCGRCPLDAAQGLLDVLQVHRLPFHHDLQNFHNQDMFVGRHENLRDVRVDHEAQPRVNLRQVRLLPAKRGAQCQESGQQCHRHVHCPLASKQPQEVVDEDEVPVHLREKRVEDPEQKGCQASPVGLGTSHAIGAYLVHPPFFPHKPPVLPEDLHSPVGLGDVRLEQHPPGARLRPEPAPRWRFDDPPLGARAP